METTISKALVHKSRDENVLLANLRRILPRVINDAGFKKLLSQASEEEISLIRIVYKLVKSRSLFGRDPHYIMKESLGALRLDTEQYEAVMRAIPEESRETFMESYERVASSQNANGCGDPDEYRSSSEATPDSKLGHDEIYILRKFLADDLLNRIIKHGGKKEYYINNALQAEASKILERYGHHDEREIFLSNLVVDTKHPFFFEHPNEHVPGIMILEACRQLVVACAHEYGNVASKGAHMILDVMEAKFDGFLELYAPVILRAQVTSKRIQRGSWSTVRMDITIHQNGEQMGRVQVSGSNVGENVFKWIREVKRGELEKLPFYPPGDLDHTLLLKQPGNGGWLEGRLERINLSGFTLQDGSAVSKSDSEERDFVLIVGGVSAKGVCSCSAIEEGYDFIITHMPDTERERLELIIKRYFKVPEKAVL